MLSTVWFAIVVFLFVGYLILDGFDFGIGVLLSLRKPSANKERRLLLNTIGPIWDGNEVWIITGIGAIFAAFPAWYATLLSVYYLPFILMLIGLITRVVAIEWRGKIESQSWKRVADFGIALGSWLPAFLWGNILASTVLGNSVTPHTVTDSIVEMFRPYPLLGGVSMLALLTLHGNAFGVLKIAGTFRWELKKLLRRGFIFVTILLILFISWTLTLPYFSRTGEIVTYIAVGVMVLAWYGVGAGTFMSTPKNSRSPQTTTQPDMLTFISTAIVVAGLVVILFVHNYPYVLVHTDDRAVLPGSLTIAQSSSSHYALLIITWVSVCTLPLVLGYQAWSYWVFRQRISLESIPEGIGLSPTVPPEDIKSVLNMVGFRLRGVHNSDEELPLDQKKRR